MAKLKVEPGGQNVVLELLVRGEVRRDGDGSSQCGHPVRRRSRTGSRKNYGG